MPALSVTMDGIISWFMFKQSPFSMTARFKPIKHMFKPPVLYGMSMKCTMPSFKEMFEQKDQSLSASYDLRYIVEYVSV